MVLHTLLGIPEPLKLAGGVCFMFFSSKWMDRGMDGGMDGRMSYKRIIEAWE